MIRSVRPLFLNPGAVTAGVDGGGGTSTRTGWCTAIKMVIIDGAAVLVSSRNWSDFAVTENREAGLSIPHGDVAQYFRRSSTSTGAPHSRVPKRCSTTRPLRSSRSATAVSSGWSAQTTKKCDGGAMTTTRLRPPHRPLDRQRAWGTPLAPAGSSTATISAPHVHRYASPASGQWHSTTTLKRHPQSSCVQVNKVPGW